MRKSFVIIITLIGFLAFGQENNLDRIDNEVNSNESDSTLEETEFDWVELTGITADGVGMYIRQQQHLLNLKKEMQVPY